MLQLCLCMYCVYVSRMCMHYRYASNCRCSAESMRYANCVQLCVLCIQGLHREHWQLLYGSYTRVFTLMKLCASSSRRRIRVRVTVSSRVRVRISYFFHFLVSALSNQHNAAMNSTCRRDLVVACWPLQSVPCRMSTIFHLLTWSDVVPCGD